MASVPDSDRVYPLLGRPHDSLALGGPHTGYYSRAIATFKEVVCLRETDTTSLLLHTLGQTLMHQRPI